MTWRWLFALLALVGCHREPVAPLPQRAYVWQREWTPAVSEAATQADTSLLNGLMLFGAEIAWDQGKPHIIYGSIDWVAVRRLHRPMGIALRVAPHSGPFVADDLASRTICDTAQLLLGKMKAEGVPCAEFHLDFDCAQKKLAGYATWARAVREVVKPTRFLITTLPSWLSEPEFAKLIEIPDRYVLQVHSVAPPKNDEPPSICDPERARRWVTKAAALGRPFEVALSTYSALAGHDPSGRLLGVALDGVQPSWPRGTRVTPFDSDASALSALVLEWNQDRPAQLKGLLWYRLPISTDVRNWRWPTFAAVMEGREPRRELRVEHQGDKVIDFTLLNAGEADENLDRLKVQVTWTGPGPMDADALPGWKVELDGHHALFELTEAQRLRLSPGGRRGMGWLRFDQRASLHVEIVR